jgi:hypothetical protein
MFLSSLRRARPNLVAPLRALSAAPRARNLTASWPRRAALATQPSAQPTVLLVSPSPEYLEQEEIDVELLPPQHAQIIITDRAAEVRVTGHDTVHTQTFSSNSVPYQRGRLIRTPHYE